jgi:hypothetical protein
MSAKLEKAIANKQLLVRKVAAGEVAIHFHNPEMKPICLPHHGVVDIFSKRGVTSEVVRKSNIKYLLENKFIEIL